MSESPSEPVVLCGAEKTTGKIRWVCIRPAHHPFKVKRGHNQSVVEIDEHYFVNVERVKEKT